MQKNNTYNYESAKIVEKLIKTAQKSLKSDDVPVAAFILKDNIIISKGYNRREKDKNVLAHAEIIAIQKANKSLQRWNLNDCDMFVTLKPCSMCEAVIKQARLRNVYYLLEKEPNKKEYNKTNIINLNLKEYQDKYHNILASFFKKMR